LIPHAQHFQDEYFSWYVPYLKLQKCELIKKYNHLASQLLWNWAA